jgi:hypothetical protein
VVAARRADSVVESVGVNVHLGYSDSVYDRFKRIRFELDRLGVRYIRDGISLGRPDLYARLGALARDGIRLDAIAGDPLRRYGTGSLHQQVRLLTELGPGILASIEGPNEFDNQGVSNWRPILRNYQRRLFQSVRRHASLHSIPVLGPSLVDYDSRAELGDISAWTDEGNMHPYPGGERPDDDHIGEELELAAENTGTEPVQATETGYTNAVRATSGQGPTSERAAATYMPRLLLENFRRGITRTFIYQLVDTERDRNRNDTEAGFGLLRHDLTPKPAYAATRNLISLLADPGPGFAPGQLSYSVAGAPPDLHEVLLQQRDGSFYLALWRSQSVWDLDRRANERVQPAAVTIEFDRPVARAAAYIPNRSTAPVARFDRPGELQIAVGPRVTILEVDPGVGLSPSLRRLIPPGF